MDWIVKNHSKTTTSFDPQVVVSKANVNSKPNVCFRFRKNCHERIVGSNPYVIIAREGTRIYFKESSPRYGWKLSHSASKTYFFKLHEKQFPFNENDYGEYNLEYDSKVGLYYIDTEHRLTDALNWNRKRGL